MKRSAIRESSCVAEKAVPDFALLHPGYASDEDQSILGGDCNLNAAPDHSMPIKFWAFITFVVLAFASIPLQPATAQSSANHALSWGAMFNAQVRKCWNKPDTAGKDVAGLRAAFTIKLTRDGRLAETPLLEKPAASGLARSYQESAQRAINACQPYKLPIEYYDEWKQFDPVFLEPSR